MNIDAKALRELYAHVQASDNAGLQLQLLATAARNLPALLDAADRLAELEEQLRLANIDALQTEAERAALEAENQRLRAELARVRELAAKWRAAPQNPDEPLLAMAADELDAALSRAAERESLPLMARQEWMRRDTDYFVVHDDFCLEVKALNGRAPYYDESGELVVCAEVGDSIERDQVDAEAQPDGIYRIVDPDEHSLPLMARRPRHKDDDLGELYENGKRLCTISGEPPLREPMPGFVLYRIADTDEHGLKVIPRTEDMPEGAKYRLTWIMQADAAGGDVEYTDSLPLALEANRSGAVSERIEDYRPAAQESGDA